MRPGRVVQDRGRTSIPSDRDEWTRQAAARAVHEVALRENVDMPIVSGIYRVLYEHEPAKDVVKNLMTRPIRPEVE